MGKKLKREVLEWTILLGVLAGLYLTGWHTEVIGMIQRGILSTGIIRPDLEEPTAVDASFDLLLRKEDGQVISLEEMRGKVIFINFWATWCSPCVAEMPEIHALFTKVGKEVEFVMISRDDQPEKAWAFAKRKEYTFPVYTAASAIPDVFKSQSIPTTFVISPSGKIVLTNTGMAQYDHKKFIDFLENVKNQ